MCAMTRGAPVGLAASSFTLGIGGPAAGLGLCAELLDHPGLCFGSRARAGAQRAGRRARRGLYEPVARSVTGSPVCDGSSCPAARSWSTVPARGWTAHAAQRDPRCDHSIVVLEICALGADPATPPLVFHGSRFRRLAAVGPEECR